MIFVKPYKVEKTPKRRWSKEEMEYWV